MVEYGLIVGVISLLSLSTVTLLGESTGDSFDEVTTALDDGSGGGGVVDAGGESTGGGGSTDSGATTTTTTPSTTTTTAPAPTTTSTTPAATTTTIAVSPKGTVETGATSATLTTWKKNKGDWTASVEYSNDWNQDQYLTLRITEVDHTGKTTATLVDGFLVPAGGHATFDHVGNAITKKRGKLTGVVEVKVEVVSITTTDGDSQVLTYEVTGEVATVSAPTP